MKLTFLGTRGYIETSNRRHRRHSSTLVSYYDTDVMIDCGEDWLGHLDEVNPNSIVLTHAHPDHAWGLKEGSPCEVYGTENTVEELKFYGIDDFTVVEPREPFELDGLVFEAFEVEHSTRCPTVGYRVTAGNVTIFYVPDVVYIHERTGKPINKHLDGRLHRKKHAGGTEKTENNDQQDDCVFTSCALSYMTPIER